MILHADWSYVEQEFGFGLRDWFLMPVRSFDNARSVTPFILDRDGRRTALFVHVEHGNAHAAPLPAAMGKAFYRPYFTFEPASHGPVHANLTDAIHDLSAGDRSLLVDAKLPIAVAAELAKTFEVACEETSCAGPVTIRKVAATETSELLAEWRPAAARAASRLLDRSPVRDAVVPYFDAPAPDRFGLLDRLLDGDDIDALLLTTRLNIQEIAGVPMRAKKAPMAAIYLPGGDAWVVEVGTTGVGRTFPSIRDALVDVCPTGTIGCEMDDLGIGLFRASGMETRDHVGADTLLRRWRDQGTLPDLPFYVVATRISARAMEAALAYAKRMVGDGVPITELDAYRVYFETLHASLGATMPDLRLGKTLTNFHSGARTVFPSNAAPAHLSVNSNMLKLDTGCLLFDRRGVLLGCSDIARTLAFSEEGREMYAIFERGVRQTLVHACAVGTSGAAIHAAGVDAVWGKNKPSNNRLFVDFPDPVARYDRDVGHLLGKNNLSHLTFTRHTTDVLSEGMIACCEYQWPIAGHALAYEDTCLVTPSGGLNVTSDGT